MGNAPSGEMEPARLKEELADMHRSLQALSFHCRPPPALRSGQISVDNVIVSTRKDVKVVLGPVVGKVEFQRARVLLEVNRRAVVTAHVSTLDAATNSMVELPQLQVAVQCEADRPAVFVLERLVPGKSYTVTFGGIRREDVESQRGSFRTQSLEHGDALNVVVVSGDNVYDIESGEANLWKDVRERVEHEETQVVLHLGGQVAMGRMFDKAVQLLLLYGQGLSSDGAEQPDWSMMEAKALDVLRSTYRSQWTLSTNLKFVLANACNLMMWSDADVYLRFTTRDEFYIDHEQPTLQMQVVRTVTRCGRRLFHEYQRQLWDNDFKQLVEREVELLAISEKALSTTAQIFALSNQIPKTAEELELQKKRHEIEGARRVEKNLRALEAEKVKLEKQLLLAQATTEAEEEQIKDRMAFLRDQEGELQASFQRSPALVNGLVTLTNAKSCAHALAASFKTAHHLGRTEFRDYFPRAPSSFIVTFTLQQLRTAEPPVQQLSQVGAVEFEQYALIFQHSFVNTWLFNNRLENLWS
ncbi:uncharacterized protein IUM83_12305 [Phytophthora cinnamomi]|uniref:uncharacterized protein n=1 Tax=Phytophthora cinnamomi TaxID=4785 RepID=UPI003559FA01|nr:hypothetical protein IUM83_12305 [Phytophthora cinnamomi]